MGPDIEVADAGPVGQRQGQRRRAALLAPADLQQMGDGAGAEGIAFARAVAIAAASSLRPVVVEQGEEAPGVWAQRLAACREAVEEGGGGRDRHAEPVPGGVAVGLARGGEQPREMRSASSMVCPVS